MSLPKVDHFPCIDEPSPWWLGPWSSLVGLLWFLLSAAARLFPQHEGLRSLTAGRTLDGLGGLVAAAKTAERRYLFFCSSAGEYEQALPLMERLGRAGQGKAAVLVVFFSPSGIQYAKARGDQYPYTLAPPDTLGQWQKVFSAFNPQAVVVVRHEWWPAFLATARSRGLPCLLINAGRRGGQRRYGQGLRRWWQSQLVGFFTHVSCVSEDDRRYFAGELAVPAARLTIDGDTKYDRVIERAVARQEMAAALRALLSEHIPPCPVRLVLGSAWPADVDLSLAAMCLLREQGEQNLQMIIALHKPSEEALATVEASCARLGVSVARLSGLTGGNTRRASLDVLLVDRMGILAEIYAAASLALVGGALHHQVHNVLEPASYGLALAYGPLYKNSGEAAALAEAGLATIVHTPAEFAAWWLARRQEASRHQPDSAGRVVVELGAATQAFVKARCGAAEKICTRLPGACL